MNVNPKPTIKIFTTLVCLTWSNAASAWADSLTPDTQFRPPLFAEPYTAVRTVLQPDGKVFLFFNTDTLTDVRTGAISRYLPDGALDTAFNFSRAYKSVHAAAPAQNGQVVLAALQYTYGSPFGSEQVLRVNADGSIDSTFHISTVWPYPVISVRSIVVEPDGKVLVVGGFTDFAGSGRSYIVQLSADGTIDSTFNPPEIFPNFYGIYPKPVLTDGKILIAGDFLAINGISNPGVARLNSDGSLDSSFQPTGFSRIPGDIIRGIKTTSDGKIVLGGRVRIGAAPRIPLIRLNPDGSVDETFSITQSTQSDVAVDLVIQSDDKVVAAIYPDVTRFDTTGAVDSSFTPPNFVDITYSPDGYPGSPNTLSLQTDGRIIVAGNFTDVNPTGTPGDSHYGMARLNSDGSVDPTFTTSHRTGFEDFPTGFARLPNGSVWSAFTTTTPKHDPAAAFGLASLQSDGSLDPSFTLTSSDSDGILSKGFVASNLVRLSDGEFFVFGPLTIGGSSGAKFFSDGSQDRAFELEFTLSYFQEATPLANGKVLLAAGNSADDTLWATFGRIRRDGVGDVTFQLAPAIRESQVIRDAGGYLEQISVGSQVLAVEPNGRALVTYLSFDKYYHFCRLNYDGSIDSSFPNLALDPINLTVDYLYVFDPLSVSVVQPPGGVWSATSPIQGAHILPNGKIVLCGQFTSFNGVPARELVRLLEDGTVDPSFNVGDGAQWTETVATSSFFPAVEGVEAQNDGKLLIVGTFEAFNGVALPGIASLNSDGSVDSSFVPPAKRLKTARGIPRLARQPDGSFLLSGPYALPEENEPAFIHINNAGGIPIVGSAPQGTAIIGQPFRYQIEASGQPTSYSATGLPPGFTINPATGIITGTPTEANIGIYVVSITATNGDGTSATFYLTLSVIPAQIGLLPSLQNISTRLNVLAGDNALIGGFIIPGSTPRRIIVRAIGPSLTNLGVSGALTDPILELHGPAGFVTVTNDNWKDTQQNEIEATQIPPTNDLESAIVATLPPGAYTAIVRGKNDGTGVGLVEAYDLESGSLANISTRGFVDVGKRVMIGGLIAGPSDAGSGQALVRAIGPSLTALGVPSALQDPTLELHDSNGDLIASNNNWRDTQGVAIEATGIAPTDDHEAAILTILSPGSYTAVVTGEGGSTGVGLVEVYNLN